MDTTDTPENEEGEKPKNPAFTALLQSFLQLTGNPLGDAEKSLGLEFSSGDHAARIAPHPLRDTLLFIEIDVRELSQEEAIGNPRGLFMLHRLNEAARFEHDWTASIDADDMLILSALFPIAEMDGRFLQNLLIEGLDLAGSLTSLWKEADAAELPGEDTALVDPSMRA